MSELGPATARLSFEVTSDDTARALGSGELDVLATPRLIAWCEAATVAAAVAGGLVPAGSTTVGSRVLLAHRAPTPPGGRVRVLARLMAAEHRVLRFEVEAVDRSGRVVASGQVDRVVVDVGRFTARVPPP